MKIFTSIIQDNLLLTSVACVGIMSYTYFFSLKQPVDMSVNTQKLSLDSLEELAGETLYLQSDLDNHTQNMIEAWTDAMPETSNIGIGTDILTSNVG